MFLFYFIHVKLIFYTCMNHESSSFKLVREKFSPQTLATFYFEIVAAKKKNI